MSLLYLQPEVHGEATREWRGQHCGTEKKLGVHGLIAGSCIY